MTQLSQAISPSCAPLPSRAVIAVAGPDWRSFLQGLLTQDVESLAEGELRFAALLTPQGRLLFDLFLLGREHGCLLDCAAEHRAALLQRLTMYRLRAKVEIAEEATPVWALWDAASAPRSLSSPSGGGTGEAGDGGGLGETRAAAAPSTPSGSPSPEGGGEKEFAWSLDPRAPGLGWRGYGVAPPAGAAVLSEADYVAHCLALGAPGPADWGHDRSYPIEANFDLLGGIDFRKGCFVGQETTSRMKRRGRQEPHGPDRLRRPGPGAWGAAAGRRPARGAGDVRAATAAPWPCCVSTAWARGR